MPLGPAPLEPNDGRDAMMPLVEQNGRQPTAPLPADHEPVTVDASSDLYAGGPRQVPAPHPSFGTFSSNMVQAAGAPATPPHPRSSLDYSLDAIEGNFRNIVPGWRKQGLNEAATNLEWFLDGSGKTRFIDRDQARSMKPIVAGEELNTWRTENSFTDPDPDHGHAGKLLTMKDGETITISDEWDRDFGNDDFTVQLLGSESRDFALAFGNTKFHSKGDFKASRSGDEITIEGVMVHDWKDRYQFHPDRYMGVGGFLAKGASALEQHRGAKPFDTKSSWARRITGKIRVENGKLREPTFSWEDIEE
jgi:hypothetical protein